MRHPKLNGFINRFTATFVALVISMMAISSSPAAAQPPAVSEEAANRIDSLSLLY